MSEAVSILLTSCDRGCNPRIVFGGARIVLISTVQHFWLVTLPISVYPSAQDDEAGMFGEMAGQPPFPRQKGGLQIASQSERPLEDLVQSVWLSTNDSRFVYSKTCRPRI